MDVAITKMSSKGQVVIPQDFRKNINEGEKLLIIQSGDQLILRKASSLDLKFEEDIEFLKRTNKAIKDYESGNYKTLEVKEFLNDLEEW